MAITLIPQEQIIFQTKAKIFTLTSHRVLYHTDVGGVTDTISIMLEDLCSCSAGKNDPKILLAVAAGLAVAGLIFGVVSQNGAVAVGGIILGTLVAFIYLAIRRATLALASAGAVMRIDMNSFKAQEITQIVAQIATAKDARYQLQRFTYPQP